MANDREFLRHTLATLAYRGGKAIRGAPASFTDFNGAGKTPGQILAHIGDLMEWALSMAEGAQKWNDTKPSTWERDSARFFAELKKFDDFLEGERPLQVPAEKLFQGPVADALTHVGQIAMLRRMAGARISGENYFVAEIAVGRVGDEQAAPKKEF